MKRSTLLAIGALCALGTIPVRADNILPGGDLLFTPAPGAAPYTARVVVPPLPAGAFGAGSDPFPGVPAPGVPLVGLPPEGTPALDPFAGHGLPGQADTIVRRLTVAPLVCGGAPMTVPIEIVALSLVSVQPITVTFGGGASSSPYEVRVCLSLSGDQQQGQIQIIQTTINGGMFFSTLPVRGRLMFAKCNPAGGPGLASPPDFDPHTVILMSAPGAQWTTNNMGLPVMNSPGGGMVDHDCLGTTPLVPYPATSNFIPGVADIGGNCVAGGAPGKMLTSEDDALARHGVLPPNAPPGPHGGFGDGTMGPCPCGNNSTTPGRGCQHSESAAVYGGAGALLYAAGTHSVSVDSGGGFQALELRAIDLRRPPTIVVFWQGNTLLAAGVFAGDGLRFVNNALRRIGIKAGCNGKVSYGAGFGDVPVATSGAVPAVGGSRHYQVAYRDGAPAHCLPNETVNWTNAVSIPWIP